MGVEPTVGRLLQTTQYLPQIKTIKSNQPHRQPNQPNQQQKHSPAVPHPSVSETSRGWQACPLPGPLGAMDGAHEPPWVKAHCSRGTASHATEHPAASGWTELRSGVHGVSRTPIRAGPARAFPGHGCRFGVVVRQPGRARLYGYGPAGQSPALRIRSSRAEPGSTNGCPPRV